MSLEPFFAPRHVAVIGASETPGKVGQALMVNLVQNDFGGTVYPVNPARRTVLGRACYQRIGDLPEPVDLAILAIPATQVPELVGECIDAGVKAAIVVAAGFSEVGPAGEARTEALQAQLARGSMRLLGPNCLGVIMPHTRLNASFARRMARPGQVGFITQSGALATAILDWSLHEHVGFSALCSIGAMVDVGWGDLIGYLGDDGHTRTIVCYMESPGDPRELISAAREVAAVKPIIVLRAGQTAAGARAATLHTGAEPSSDAILDAALRRCGVLRVHSIGQLFDMAEVLGKQPRPRGPRLAIVTNAGGPGVIAADALTQGGGIPARFSPTTDQALASLLPSHAAREIILDLQADASPERYARAVQIVATDPGCDSVLVILAPQSMTEPARTAERIAGLLRPGMHPILASWMGAEDVAEGEALLNHAGIPTYSYPDAAARAFLDMWRYSENLRALYETPSLPIGADHEQPDRAHAAAQIAAAQQAGRTALDEHEARALLSSYGLPAARESRSGVSAFELAISSITDPHYGPVIRFGAGGTMGALVTDQAIGLPPLTTTLARRVMEQTCIFRALAQLGQVNQAALEALLVRLSWLVLEQPRIASVLIDPLRASIDGFVARAVQITLHPAAMVDAALPRPAIRPYPAQYAGAWNLRDGTPVVIRPIRPEDEPLMVRFHQTLSEESVFFRYFYPLRLSQRVAHERLARICSVDYDRAIALVVEITAGTGDREIIGIGRLNRMRNRDVAEFALLIGDQYHGQGLGTEIMRRLLEIGRQERLARIVGTVLAENYGMLRICERLGFRLRHTRDAIETTYDLDSGEPND